jgi:ribonuclease Y
MNIQSLLIWAGLVLSGAIIGYLTRQSVGARKASSVEQKLRQRIQEAEIEAKDILLSAKTKAAEVLDTLQKEERERKSQISRLEERVIKREEAVESQSRDLGAQKQKLEKSLTEADQLKKELEEIQKKAILDLEKVAKISAEEARTQIFEKVKQQGKEDLLHTIQKIEREKREEIEKKAGEIITTAIQRYARSQVADITTSVFHLPNEEMKGKIIGREGRNIRTLERATGAEIIVDEGPESIIISSYDPLRREIAMVALEKLVKDGRIQPAKIEEKVEEARQELDSRMMKIGEDASFEVGIVDLPKELLMLLGRMHFRTSYGQNVLLHSIEMAHISGMIAAELKANVEIAKKGALLHDIGKAISHEVEGTHVELGRKLLKKYGIDERVIQAMEAHHEEYPFSTPESFIVAAADVLSAARPGARRDTIENYIKRLQDLEKIAASFEGVKNAYALSAGREVRVFVVPERIDDFGAYELAKNIAGKIQSELKYPGEIKVNVIREVRAVEYAK